MPAEPIEHAHEIQYHIVLAGRDPVWPQFTYNEAMAMHALGFRFSIFDTDRGEYRLSIPYSVLRIIDRDALIFIQSVCEP